MSTRWSINITPIERAVRVVLGSLTALVGLVPLTRATSALAVTPDVLLVLAGLDLVVTGALGHCPPYSRLGYVPTSLKGRM
jgi:hypothetical protein